MSDEAEALMNALLFSPEDLEANRRGQLSRSQLERLRGIRRREAGVASLVFVVLVFCATVLLFLGQLSERPILFAIGSLLVLLNAVVVGLGGRAWMRLGGDMRADRVDALAGRLERVLRRGRTGDNFILRVSGVELAVTKEVFRAFEHEARYRLYRASHSRLLLSAERAG